jgi:hypothetical protein
MGRLGADHPSARPWVAGVLAAAGWGAAFLRSSRGRTRFEDEDRAAEERVEERAG